MTPCCNDERGICRHFSERSGKFKDEGSCDIDLDPVSLLHPCHHDPPRYRPWPEGVKPRDPVPRRQPPEDLNPGIRETVWWLHAQNFDTVDSGDGKTGDHACDRSRPYVAIVVQPRQLVLDANRLKQVLVDRGVTLVPVGGDGPWLQASYDPTNGVGLLNLHGVDDRLLGLNEEDDGE